MNERVAAQQARFLIATDGSASAHAAVATGVELAAKTGATVRFLHSASPLAERLYNEHVERHVGEEPTREELMAHDAVLAQAVAYAAEHGIEAEVELIPKQRSSTELAAAIAGIASGIDATLIVVGSRGRSAAAGAMLGSVSHGLVRYATVPTLVVHADTAAAKAAGGTAVAA